MRSSGSPMNERSRYLEQIRESGVRKSNRIAPGLYRRSGFVPNARRVPNAHSVRIAQCQTEPLPVETRPIPGVIQSLQPFRKQSRPEGQDKRQQTRQKHLGRSVLAARLRALQKTVRKV